MRSGQPLSSALPQLSRSGWPSHEGEVDEAVKQWKKARELDSSIENIDEKINQGKIIQ